MKTDRLRHFLDNLKQGISRFLAFFVWSWILFGVLSFNVLAEPSSRWVERVVLTLVMGMGFSVFLVLLAERFEQKPWLQWLCLVPMALTFFLCPDLNNAYMQMRYIGILLALACVCLCLLFSKENRSALIAHLIKAIFWTPLVAALLTGSIMLCLSAIDVLIFDFDSDLYVVVAYWIWIVFFFNLFLAYVPKRKDTLSPAKLYKVLVLCIGLPVYLLLLAILLLYLLKIVITQHMPVGQINWFASFASLFFVFFSFAVRPYEENKLVRLFQRWIGFVILPIIAMQLIAIYERVAAYGLTTPRTVSLILVGIAIVFALGSLLRKKTDSLFYLVGAVILIFTLTPKFNIIDMPKQSQLQILEECLLKNEMLSKNGITPKSDIPEEDKARIEGAYQYLRYRAEPPLPQWLGEDIREKTTEELFGFSVDNATEEIYCYYSGSFDESPVDIQDYRTMVPVSFSFIEKSEDIAAKELVIGDKTHLFDVQKFCLNLYETYGSNADIVSVAITDDLLFLLDNVHFQYHPQTDAITYLTIRGYFLQK